MTGGVPRLQDRSCKWEGLQQDWSIMKVWTWSKLFPLGKTRHICTSNCLILSGIGVVVATTRTPRTVLSSSQAFRTVSIEALAASCAINEYPKLGKSFVSVFFFLFDMPFPPSSYFWNSFIYIDVVTNLKLVLSLKEKTARVRAHNTLKYVYYGAAKFSVCPTAFRQPSLIVISKVEQIET